ncbi:MAG: alpha/beta hydrolase fold domain-containing protein, partial [Planctomycetota bacterium]
NRFPLGLDDCETALKWFHDHCESFGVDRKDIGVGGTSAGGGLAASLAIRDLKSGSRLVNYQYLGFPVLDQSCSTDSANRHKKTPNWTSAANRLMWRYYLGSERPSEVSSPAALADATGLPKTLIWTAEFDPLHDEALDYANKLASHGVQTTLFDYRSCIHGFDSIPRSAGVILEAHQHQSEFFRELGYGRG